MIISTNFSSLSIKESPREPVERNISFTKKIRLSKRKGVIVKRVLALRSSDTLSTLKITNLSADENLVVSVGVHKSKDVGDYICIIESLSIKEINKRDYKPNAKIKCNQNLQISYTNALDTGIIEISGEYKRLS